MTKTQEAPPNNANPFAPSGDPQGAIAAKATMENRLLRKQLMEVQVIHEKMRSEMDALLDNEHYPGVITAVEINGQVQAEVHVQGMSRLRVRIHPAVDPSELRVGARCHLTKGRNCLIDVLAGPPLWNDVATFETYLDENLVLLKHMEQLLVVRLAASLEGTELKPGDRIGFHRDAGLAYQRLPRKDCEHLFASEVPPGGFENLHGLNSQIAKLTRAIDFRFRYPDIARAFRLPEKNGILLDGPPGNGKTRLAGAAAGYLATLMPNQLCRFMAVNGSQDYSMWLGGTEGQLRDRFDAVRQAAKDGPVVLFFDEIDAIARRRGTDFGSGAPDRILATLLGQLDDVGRTLRNILILAATNRADQLDNGLLRPGRLGLKIHIPPPQRGAAEAIVRGYLQGLPLSQDANLLVPPLVSELYSPRGTYAEFVTVKLNDGRQHQVPARELISGAVLESVVQRAAEAAAVRTASCGRQSPIAGEDLSLELEAELLSMARLLVPSNVKSYVPSLPADTHPVDVRIRYTPRFGSQFRSA